MADQIPPPEEPGTQPSNDWLTYLVIIPLVIIAVLLFYFAGKMH